MKSTGIVRKIDGLGRIVLPIELRKRLEIATGDDIEIYVEGDILYWRNTHRVVYFAAVKSI